MRVEVQRSGLVEAVHRVAVAVTDTSGKLQASTGDVDRPFFLRSAAKPFQAMVCQRLGAELDPAALALACASHDGDPVHLATVRRMLTEARLGEEDLRCPPAWPLSASATRRLQAAGHVHPRRLWSNCSGKHAAMLRASLSQGFDLRSYLRPDHPLQVAIREEMRSLLGGERRPPGIDGCGAPVFAGDAVVLAGAFARLAEDAAYDEVFDAMHRFPALVSGVGNTDATAAIALHAAAKRGAEGCLGLAVRGIGGIAIKVWDGGSRAVGAALAAALERIGWVPSGMVRRVREALDEPVLGGGRRVGRVVGRWT